MNARQKRQLKYAGIVANRAQNVVIMGLIAGLVIMFAICGVLLMKKGAKEDKNRVLMPIPVELRKVSEPVTFSREGGHASEDGSSGIMFLKPEPTFNPK